MNSANQNLQRQARRRQRMAMLNKTLQLGNHQSSSSIATDPSIIREFVNYHTLIRNEDNIYVHFLNAFDQLQKYSSPIPIMQTSTTMPSIQQIRQKTRQKRLLEISPGDMLQLMNNIKNFYTQVKDDAAKFASDNASLLNNMRGGLTTQQMDILQNLLSRMKRCLPQNQNTTLLREAATTLDAWLSLRDTSAHTGFCVIQ